jgi:acetyltransferase-like isoleucine patch superfamily enzyme
VIPAHDEEAVLVRSLRELLAGTRPGEWHVMVVSNGSSDGTAAVARRFALDTGHAVEVLEVAEASKIAAVRLGLAFTPPGVRVVLDADVGLGAETLRALVDALVDAGEAARLGCPQMEVDTARSARLVQAYYRTWTALPYVRRTMVGSGVYALTDAAVRRLGRLPEVINDDGWVRRSFSSAERIMTPGAFTVTAPRTVTALVRRRARIAIGNRDLTAQLGPDPDGNGLRALVHAVRDRQVDPIDAGAYAVVGALSEGLAGWRRLTGRRATWSTDTTTRAAGAANPEEDPVRRSLAAVARVLRPATIVQLVKMANFYGYAHVEPRRRLTAGPGLRLAPNASLRNGERIHLGREVHVGERSCLWAGDSSGTITLGDNALLGPEVFITASNYLTAPGTPVMYQPKREADVVIGSDVWLGARVMVMPGVTIGNGAVVGAGAIVSRSLPPGCIAVGAPARIVGWRDGRPVGELTELSGAGDVDDQIAVQAAGDAA